MTFAEQSYVDVVVAVAVGEWPLVRLGCCYLCEVREKDAGFDWLEKAFHERTSFLAYFKFHPLFDNLHGDLRFDALVKRIGIPD
jgi:hypothetical protein